jgi:DNA invertase Pin-like site-specific DNA recombinase
MSARTTRRPSSPRSEQQGLRLIGYVRVSTAQQATDRSHGLAAQWRALERWCRALGHVLVTVIPEVASTRDPERMYGRLAVEAALRAGLADAMAVPDIDRASRSTLDGAQLVGRATATGWRIVGTDGVDTADPEQEFLVNVRLAMAQEERRKIARRTREGLDAARAKGHVLGRPRTIPPAVERRIVRLRTKDGLSALAIARQLTAKKVPTPSGAAEWSPSTIRAVFARHGVDGPQPTRKAVS